jgi:hypothetical protein
MRYLLFAAISAVAVATTGSISPAAAQPDYPYCLQGKQWGYPGLCYFSTYEQCQATASGTNAGCGINPRFAYAPQRPRYWR